MNGVVKNIAALSIQHTGQIPSLTKGQKALLKLIRDCVEKKRSLTFDSIVLVYYENVRQFFYRGNNVTLEKRFNSAGQEVSCEFKYHDYIKYDILECWRKQEYLYSVRPPIRQWFVANVGILVVKNQLVVIPTIDLGEEETEQKQ